MSVARTLSSGPRFVSLLRLQTAQCCIQVCHRSSLLLNPDNSKLLPQGDLHRNSTVYLQSRGYAKKGKKDKGGGKGAHKKVDLSPEELDGLVDMQEVDAEMQHVLDDLKQQYIQQLSLRTTTGVFDKLVISTNDGRFPLIQLGQIVQKSPQLLVINMSTSPQHISAVKTAITESGMNVNPQQDGTSLFVPIPKVTKEHRENLAKSAKQLCDKVKVRLRDIHNKHAKHVKATKEGHSEDILKGAQDLLLEKMHSYSAQADTFQHAKQKDLLGTK